MVNGGVSITSLAQKHLKDDHAELWGCYGAVMGLLWGLWKRRHPAPPAEVLTPLQSVWRDCLLVTEIVFSFLLIRTLMMFEEIETLLKGMPLNVYRRSSHARMEGHRYIMSSLMAYFLAKRIRYAIFHPVELDSYEGKRAHFFDFMIEHDGVKYLIDVYSTNRARALEGVLRKLESATTLQCVPVLINWVKRPTMDIPHHIKLVDVGLGDEEQVDFLEKEKLRSDNLKKVSIYSMGSCDPTTRLGRYHALLEFGEKRKYLTRELSDTTANRCIIQGLIDCVDLLKTPCAADLITSTRMGEAGIKKGKGPNVDLLSQLVGTLRQRGCDLSFIAREGEGDSMAAYIKRFASPVLNGDNPTVENEKPLTKKEAKKRTEEEHMQENLAAGKPMRANLRWSDEERDEVCSLFKGGSSVESIAEKQMRGALAIAMQLEKAGLISKEKMEGYMPSKEHA